MPLATNYVTGDRMESITRLILGTGPITPGRAGGTIQRLASATHMLAGAGLGPCTHKSSLPTTLRCALSGASRRVRKKMSLQDNDGNDQRDGEKCTQWAPHPSPEGDG